MDFARKHHKRLKPALISVEFSAGCLFLENYYYASVTVRLHSRNFDSYFEYCSFEV